MSQASLNRPPRVSLSARVPWLVALSVCLVSTPALAQANGAPAPGDPGAPVDFVEITPETRRAVDRGLAYLAEMQDDDGGFPSNHAGHAMGISSLALLAFLADGNLPGRGPYGENVERGLQYVLRHAQENGLIATAMGGGPMYGHGYATLFLGEVYGMTQDERVREALRKAVRLIVISQNHEGGWRYNPVPLDADISVTICQIMALRSARNAGISVPKETIDDAIEYVRQCQNPGDGGFRYKLGMGGSAFPRSAAGVASLYYAGIYQDDALAQGLDYLMDFHPQVGNQAMSYYFYGHYYAVQAMYLAGGEYWAKWYPAIRDALVASQRNDGSWRSQHGDVYGAANALLILQQPNRLLPIYQK